MKAAPDQLCVRAAQSVGSHQLLNAEEERALTRDAQHLTRLEALAAPEVERLGRKLLLHEWAALAGEPDIDAFKARVQVPRAFCVCSLSAFAGLWQGCQLFCLCDARCRCGAVLRLSAKQGSANKSGMALLKYSTGTACS